MLRRKILQLSDLSLLDSETIRKKNINYCYGFMPDDFQVICSSMVDENCRSLATIETSAQLYPTVLGSSLILYKFPLFPTVKLNLRHTLYSIRSQIQNWDFRMWFLDCNSNFPLIHEKIENWDLLMLLQLGFSIFSNL